MADHNPVAGNIVFKKRETNNRARINRLVSKLNSPLFISLLGAFAAIIGIGVGTAGIPFGGMFLAIAIGIPLVWCLVAYSEFGVLVLLITAYLLFLLMRFIPGPLGTLMDAMQALLAIVVVVKQKKENNWALFKGPITVMVLLWIGYNLIEVANPTAESRMAWVYTVRSVAIVQISYFIFLYNIKSVKFVRLILKLWLVLSILGALYGFKQEFIGFSDSENAYLYSDPSIASLLFINGHWRKFSFFSDPVAYSYNMVMPSILCVCVIFGKFANWKKIVSLFLIILFFIAMIFSGTRGANVLLPAALLLFAILNYNKKVLIFSCIAGFFFIVLINIPTGNQNIVRFQSAFRPNNDDSYNVRKQNQKRIQPYILTHPMGGGLGATGVWGKRFAPGSFLSNFPPDSGYIRVAVENGWLGLLLFCTMMFVMMKTGINNFYLIQDPELKSYCLAATLIVFAFNIADFPQEALVQFPSNILFYLFVALIPITKNLDDQKRKNILPAASVEGT
ncbi:O-antigen ligase family protein [Mucilaginibacter sp. KACC 22063]|uniref:O-antigen ligase family protein n=1 Tax=Mucilaginibacter sp. KACC 22063 TaxID=3025666 RepID=UPI002365C309|nr:O-antigen ligase family protein [Mucilaginibacter sp. KACC 22063]WDF53685.1 O-antigen ligase family protein [Mucilaginibacter sp. KACC 22063]